MADVTARPSNRGQLVIITAVGLAVLLVVVALAVNTGVVGEIHVAQTDDSLREERGIVQYEDAIRHGVGGLIERLNEQYEEESAFEGELEPEVVVWNELAAETYAQDGVVADASVDRSIIGTFVVQDTHRAFTDRTQSANWTVVQDVADVTVYTMNITDDSLVPIDECTIADGCFQLAVNDGAWTMSINRTVDSIVVRVNGEVTCETSASTLAIDIVDGSFGGPGCPGEFTTFLEDSGVGPPYTLTYTNGDNAGGTYELAVVGDVVDDERYGTSGVSPRLEPGIVAADVNMTYRSPAMTYMTDIRVRPGDGDA